MSSKYKKPEKEKQVNFQDEKPQNETVLNTILNNDFASFFLIFGSVFSIIYFLMRLNPGNIINKYPNVFFWVFFLATLIASTLFYFVIIYKKNRGNIYSLPINDKGNETQALKKNKHGKPFVNFQDNKTKETFEKFIMSPLKILVGLIILFGGISYLLYLMLKYKYTVQILNIILIILISIVTLALLYSFLSNEIQESEKGNTFMGFLIDFIFFIPCLLIEFINYLKNQFKITTNTTWIILLIELIFIIFYFLLPILAKNLSTKGGNKLLDGPIYTNWERTLGSTKKDANYSIAVQLWINPQPSNTNANYNKYTSLFNYGNRPNILYNGRTNTLKIVMKTDKNNLVTIYKSNSFPYQSWMNFVIINKSGTFDVFLNNKLVGSLEGVMPYMISDKITSGTKNGINGGIQNVIYFDRIVNKNEILWID